MSETSAIASPTAVNAARRRAILCVLGASAAFALSAALVKSLGPNIPTIEIVLFRSLVAFIVIIPLLMRHGGWQALRTTRPLSHAVRTMYGFVGMLTSFYGYRVLPLAMVTALGFVMPLFLTVLSVPLLGERVGWRRATAILVGFAGVVVMVRPWSHGAGDDPGALGAVAFVVLGVMTWALAMISIRKMGRLGEPNVTIVAWFSLGSAGMAALFTVPVWVTPEPVQLAALLGVGVISGVAQLLMTEGYRTGETTLVAPFEYSAILYTTLLGMFVWGELPDEWNILGIAIVVASGMYIYRREVTLGIRRA
jgi:drug/metabolite transporter (DMT)-like permease